MYVLSASAQAADRDQEVFPIKKAAYGKNTAIYVRKLAYMAVFLKRSLIHVPLKGVTYKRIRSRKRMDTLYFKRE